MKLKFLYFLFIVSSIFLKAQTYNFSRFSEENGLSNSYIYCISQSHEGFLTLSAGEALCTFDGREFKSYSDTLMAENIVTTHFIDSRNITWLGHQQNGLSYVKDKRFNNFKNKELDQVKIYKINEDNNKQIWLATSNGLFIIDTGFKITHLPVLQNRSVNTIQFDKKNNLILGAMDGMIVIPPDRNYMSGLTTEIYGLKDKNIKQITEAGLPGINYWVLADDAIYGVSYKDGNYKIERQIKEELKADNFTINSIYKDKYNNLWVSVFGDGLRKVSFQQDAFKGAVSVEKIDRHNGLKSQNIQSIFQDSEGNMWFGTFGEGLIKKPFEMFSFYGSNEGLGLTNIKKIIKDPAGNLWMGTDQGLAVFNIETGSYLVYNAANGFIKDHVNALLIDSKGTMWIGTGSNGIYTLNLQSRKFVNYSKQKKLRQTCINTIIETDDRIMAGTTEGIFICDIASDWNEELTTNDGLFHNNVLHIFQDSKKRLWISSHGTPPYYIYDQKITSFKKIAGLNLYNITAVCEDKNHTIWIATDGDGVFKYEDTTFYNYTTAKGLLSNYCYGIETDKNNSVWVTHHNGLSELKSGLKKFTGFTGQKGLLFVENNINAVYKDADANLWFGTTQGAVEYKAEVKKSVAVIPEVFITSLQLNNDEYMAKDLIVKKYGYYSVHIDYKAVSLSEPDAIYYRYRLMDIDTNWKTTDMPYVDFPKLGDGEYRFEVMACDIGKGLCSNVPVSVSFIIQKPVWKYTWFYVLLAFILFMILYSIIVLRTKALKKTQAFLQLKIDQKTYLLQREKEAIETIKIDLENKNKDITDSIYYAKNIQDSLLPPEELMKELFHNRHFVLYKPKDIVSGDFYWCSAGETLNGEQLCLAAVIDCTGHGVPGAFLSILANDFLKQSVSEYNINKPHEILNYLNKSISSHFSQHSSKSKIRDGMDISLIGIDYARQKLYYSGANNPVYIFRKGPQGVEEKIIKATKQSIGTANETSVNYSLQIIDVLPGDTIYLFSDGYADQFGGLRDKKITYKTFRAILSQASQLPVHEQRGFIETRLMEWKGNTEQTDDICVMGIRI